MIVHVSKFSKGEHFKDELNEEETEIQDLRIRTYEQRKMNGEFQGYFLQKRWKFIDLLVGILVPSIFYFLSAFKAVAFATIV